MSTPISSPLTPGLAYGVSPHGRGERGRKRGTVAEPGHLGDRKVRRLDFSVKHCSAEKKGKVPTGGATI